MIRWPKINKYELKHFKEVQKMLLRETDLVEMRKFIFNDIARSGLTFSLNEIKDLSTQKIQEWYNFEEGYLEYFIIAGSIRASKK